MRHNTTSADVTPDRGEKPVSSHQARVLFVATREPSYSRVAIVRRALEESFDVETILSDKKSYALRMMSVVGQLLWAFVRGRLNRFDAVVVGFLAQPVFPLVRLLYRGPLIGDAYFSLYDTMVHDKRTARPGSLRARLAHWLDRTMLTRATMCWTDTEQHVAYLRETFEAKEADIRRLWISADSRPIEWRPPPLGVVSTFEVFFWGGFIPLQGVDTIIRAAAMLKDSDVQFTIFGAGQTLEACQALRDELGAHNVDFRGWQPASAIAEQASKSHLALGIFGTTDKAGRVIPNKAFEALAMGIPLVSRRSAAADELLIDGETARLVEPGNAEALAEAILVARRDFDAVQRMAERGRRLFNAICSPKQISQWVGETVIEVINESRAAGAPEPQPGSSRINRSRIVTGNVATASSRESR